METRPISEWPPGERPVELLERHGAATLSEAQLFAILFGTGCSAPRATALEVGRELVTEYPALSDLDRASFAELKAVRGIGSAKAARVKASLEIGRRLAARGNSRKIAFKNSRDVARYFRPAMINLAKEIFVIALMNGRHELVREVVVSVGCLTSSIVHPREVFQPAVRDGAASVLFIHNHPSGDPAPSGEDRRLTERLVEAGRILGIQVLDHVVVARGGYVSLMTDGTAG